MVARRKEEKEEADLDEYRWPVQRQCLHILQSGSICIGGAFEYLEHKLKLENASRKLAIQYNRVKWERQALDKIAERYGYLDDLEGPDLLAIHTNPKISILSHM
mmetsp:Transcript_16596/g.36149  ORF Transcript_16596/g.36149 Transcript_16596/m.36149 type:complete len:104 (-) Transcript_16596:477-788(-)